jgi:hypothetical protein
MCLPLIALAGQALAAIPGVTNAVIGHLDKQTSALTDQHKVSVEGDTKVNVEVIKADLESRRIAAASKGGTAMQWAFVGPVAFYFGVIVLDSVFQFQWNVAKLPAAWEDFALKTAYTVIGISAAGVALKRLFTR